MVHDYQLTTIGNALKYFGYSFNSNDEKQLGEAEKLMLEAKPHLFAINSDYQPSMRNGDAWMSVCWTGDATQLHRDMPEMQYVIGKEGGEIWTDYFAIPKGAPNREAAYALIDWLLTPEINAKEVAGAWLSLDRFAHQHAGAQGDAGEPDPLSGEGSAHQSRVRRRGDADQSAARRDHGALQVGLTHEPSRGAGRAAASCPLAPHHDPAVTALLVAPAGCSFSSC